MIRSFAQASWVMVPTIMVLAGCLGGVANYFLRAPNEPAGRGITKSLALAIVASLMVPIRLRCGRKGCETGNLCFIRGGDPY
jgi:hypothetical protein